MTPKAFRDGYCEWGGIKLKFNGKTDHRQLRACSQYQDGIGCSVHSGRPLACRLFPLGRQKQNTEANYIYQGSEFPCMNGCADVINHPIMTVDTYLKGQQTSDHKQVQDAYLEVMQELADIAFVFLLETGLSTSGDKKTLRAWQSMGQLSPGSLAKSIPAEWLECLIIPEITVVDSPPLDFVNQHFELMQNAVQDSFGSAANNEAWHKASCLMMKMALHLGRSIGADIGKLITLWVGIAKANGAQD